MWMKRGLKGGLKGGLKCNLKNGLKDGPFAPVEERQRQTLTGVPRDLDLPTFEVLPNMTRADATVLAKPALEDVSERQLDIGDAATRSGDDGAWRTGGQKFFPGMPLRSWALVSLTARCDKRMLHDMASMLTKMGQQQHGMVIEEPQAGRGTSLEGYQPGKRGVGKGCLYSL